jgi:hypothetical protein
MKLVVATIAAVLIAGGAQAATYIEVNAGQTLSSAETATAPGASAPLTSIFGTLSDGNDADLFRITLSGNVAFSASTVNSGTPIADTALFLFDASGKAIATNDDDASGTTFQSTLPAGNALYATLAAGTYYLGISHSENEPINASGQLLFAGYPGGDTTAVRGGATGLNPVTLANFDSNAYDNIGGAYRIDLTGVVTAGAVAPVPEPASWGLLILGMAAIGGALRRRTGALRPA